MGVKGTGSDGRGWVKALRFRGECAALALLALAVLGVVLYQMEDWRGQRRWTHHKQALRSQGEPLGWTQLVPAQVPDDQNFAATPLLRRLFDYTRPRGDGAGGDQTRWESEHARALVKDPHYFSLLKNSQDVPPSLASWASHSRTDVHAWQSYLNSAGVKASADSPEAAASAVLAALQRFGESLAELRTAETRQYARFPVRYEEKIETLLPHLAVLPKLTQILQLRAGARLAVGQSEAALEDILLGLRLAEALQNEPFILSQQVRMRILQNPLSAAWEGLASRAWTEPQLARLQERLQAIDLRQAGLQALRGDRAFLISTLEAAAQDPVELGRLVRSFSGAGARPASLPVRLLPYCPPGWVYSDLARMSDYYQEALTLLELPAAPETARAPLQRQSRVWQELLGQPLSTPRNLVARTLVPPVGRLAEKVLFSQTTLHLAWVACAVERYRLATGRPPARLGELQPRFLERLPLDLASGESLLYRSTGEGGFLLYSVGWDGRDDGGSPVGGEDADGHGARVSDWVWHCPAPRGGPG